MVPKGHPASCQCDMLIAWVSAAFAKLIDDRVVVTNQSDKLVQIARLKFLEKNVQLLLEFETLKQEVSVLRDQLRELIGPPEPWPDTPEDELTSEAFAAWPLQGFEDILGVPPVWVDCENYPCMASFAWRARLRCVSL